MNRSSSGFALMSLFCCLLLAACNDSSSKQVTRSTSSILPDRQSAADQVSSVPVANGSAAFTLYLKPQPLTMQDDLRLVIHGKTHGPECQWLVDDNVVDLPWHSQLARQYYYKGADITARCESAGELVEITTVVENIPPEITSIELQPAVIYQGIDVTARVVAEDLDDDLADIGFDYLWRINGQEVVTNNAPVLAGSLFNQGDVISLQITPSDTEVSGASVLGPEMEVVNAPPRFVSQPHANIAGSRYRYQVRVVDPEGGLVRYSLAQGPDGMTLDEFSGELVWEITGVSESHSIRILAEDVDGGQAWQEYRLDISEVQ